MRHHYPKDSEHEALWEEIQLRYFREDEQEIEPLYRAGWAALINGDFDRRTEIERLIQEKQMELCQRRWRREEILNWLYLDSELRKGGATYPDVYEAPSPAVCSVDEF